MDDSRIQSFLADRLHPDLQRILEQRTAMTQAVHH